MPKSDEIAEETRAHDLLPPDVEPYTPPVKRIAERRVAGWRLSEQLISRRKRRPAGNSRKFWARVEDDDPFLPKPDGQRIAEAGGVYAADRLVRMEGGVAQPARPSTPATPRPPPRDPRPQAPSPPQPRPQPKPQQVHTPEPRPAPPPRPPPRPAPEPEPEPEPEKPTVDRRPRLLPNPPLPNRTVAGGSGRMRVSREAPQPVARVVDEDGLTPAEARAMKREARGLPEDKPPPPPEKPKTIDDYLQFLGDLRVAEQQYNEEMARKEAEKEAKKKNRLSGSAPTSSGWPPPSVTPAPKPRPQPKPEPPPPPPPPKPEPAPEPPPVNRSPMGRGASPGGGGLDDLFGGAQEGRMRIGKRSKPKTPEEDQG